MDIFSLFVSNHCIRISAVVCKKVIWCWCRREILIYIIFVSFLRYIPLLFVVLLHAKTSDLINLCCVNNVGYYPLKMGGIMGARKMAQLVGLLLVLLQKELTTTCNSRSRNSASSLASMGTCTHAHRYTHKHVHMHQF